MSVPNPNEVEPSLELADRPAGLPPAFVCLHHNADDGTVVVAVTGELDIATAPVLDRALRDAQGRGRAVALDLGRLTFIDCRSLSVLLAAAARAHMAGDRLRIVRGPPHFERLLALTQTERRFELTGRSALLRTRRALHNGSVRAVCEEAVPA
jgi:anti-anti-sigma factor